MLERLFAHLEVAEDDVMVDIGSGMGRAVLMAARRPFKRVIGIERSAELMQIARENVVRGRRRLRCQDIELLTVDALDWEIPDDLTLAYLYCPFPDEVLERVLAKLIHSLDRGPEGLSPDLQLQHDRQPGYREGHRQSAANRADGTLVPALGVPRTLDVPAHLRGLMIAP